jgi:hypothetical protein
MPKKKKKKLASAAERSNRSSQRITSEDIKKAREIVKRRADSRQEMNRNIVEGVLKRQAGRASDRDFKEGKIDNYTAADGTKWSRNKNGSMVSVKKMTAADRAAARKRMAAKKAAKKKKPKK